MRPGSRDAALAFLASTKYLTADQPTWRDFNASFGVPKKEFSAPESTEKETGHALKTRSRIAR